MGAGGGLDFEFDFATAGGDFGELAVGGTRSQRLRASATFLRARLLGGMPLRLREAGWKRRSPYWAGLMLTGQTLSSAVWVMGS